MDIYGYRGAMGSYRGFVRVISGLGCGLRV